MKKKPIVENAKWDKQSTDALITVCLLLVVTFVIFHIVPENKRNNNIDNLEGKTIGNIISIKPKETFTQGFDGLTKQTLFYTVTFSYEVYGVKYTNTNNIPNNNKHRDFINNIYIS